MSKDTSSEVETLLTDDLRSENNHFEHISMYQNIRQENEQLYTENALLRKRIFLMNENIDLKLANVITTLLTWMDGRGTRFQTGTSKQTNQEVKCTRDTGASQQARTTKIDIQYSSRDGKGNQPGTVLDYDREYSGATRMPLRVKTPEPCLCCPGEQCPHGGTYTINKTRESSPNTRPKTQAAKNQGRYQVVGPPVAASTPINQEVSIGSEAESCSCQTPNEDRGNNIPNKMAPPPELDMQMLNTKMADNESTPREKSNNTKKVQFEAATIPPTTRLIGEIAFQLDRRILNYVFNGKHMDQKKKRFYGYTVQNIPSMIIRESVDPRTGMLDAQKKSVLQYRFDYILQSLGGLGYKMNYHSGFGTEMVNKYGLLNSSLDKQTCEKITVDHKPHLCALIPKLVQNYEIRDMKVLIECLCLLAQDDGKQVFLW